MNKQREKTNQTGITVCLKPSQLRWLENKAKTHGITKKALIKGIIAEKITDEKNLELLRRFGNSQ